MEAHGLNITEGAVPDEPSLWYAVSKARRRGLKSVPAEATPYDASAEAAGARGRRLTGGRVSEVK